MESPSVQYILVVYKYKQYAFVLILNTLLKENSCNFVNPNPYLHPLRVLIIPQLFHLLCKLHIFILHTIYIFFSNDEIGDSAHAP